MASENLYIRRIDHQCMVKQISFTVDIGKYFLETEVNHETVHCKGLKSNQEEDVEILTSTDPRFGSKIKDILRAEGGFNEGDLMLMYKNGYRDFTVELIKPSDPRFTVLNSIALGKHLSITSSATITSTTIKYKTGLVSKYERNRIIFGAPGTGKSYKLNEEAKDLLTLNKDDYERVTFYPDYSYSNFFGSYKPVPVLGGGITYEFVPGPFMRMYVKALKNTMTDNPLPHLLIIEEINRSNAASVFGDLFQLLDRDNDHISEYSIQTNEHVRKYLANQIGGSEDDYKEIKLPDNLFIWATMNSADQGVFPMDTAFKRRWSFTYIGVDTNDSLIENKFVKLGTGTKEMVVSWNELRKSINNFLSDNCRINEDKLLGPFFLDLSIITNTTVDPTTSKDMIDSNVFSKVFKDKVIMYLFEDAAKQKRSFLFNSSIKFNRYSKICDTFDNDGVFIFSNDITKTL